MNDVEYLTAIVSPLMEKPETLKIERTLDELGVLLNLSCCREDAGRLIGKEGRTAKSLRILLHLLGAKQKARYNLRVNSDEQNETGTNSDYKE